MATTVIQGLRDGRIVFDPDGSFAAVQERAGRFTWDEAMRRKAAVWISGQLVGWAEEALKGLEGLARDDSARLLQARHGLSWGMNRVMQVHLGVLVSGDNGFLTEVGHAAGEDSIWTGLRNRAFGITCEILGEQVQAGLELYVETVRLVAADILPEHREITDNIVRMILGGL
jgi:hypothetical protein